MESNLPTIWIQRISFDKKDKCVEYWANMNNQEEAKVFSVITNDRYFV